MSDDTRDMTKRQELLADYLAQLIEDKGQSPFLERGDNVQILICMHVVEDLYEIFGKGKNIKNVKEEEIYR